MSAANWHAYRSFSRDRSITQQRLNKGIVRRIASYARPYRWTLALFLVCTCVSAVITVAVPLLLKTIIDQGILHARHRGRARGGRPGRGARRASAP